MAQKLWEKNVQVDAGIDRFTVGRDREMDLYLAPYDILGSIAHITMLESIGLLTRDELDTLTAELRRIYAVAEAGEFEVFVGGQPSELLCMKFVYTDKKTCYNNAELKKEAVIAACQKTNQTTTGIMN